MAAEAFNNRGEKRPKDLQSERKEKNIKNIENIAKIAAASVVFGVVAPEIPTQAYRDVFHSPEKKAAHAAKVKAEKEDFAQKAIKRDLEDARKRLDEATREYEQKRARAKEKGIE